MPEHRLRACISAGEALPTEVGNAWLRLWGVDILDGVGSTEMLHIFLSNRPGDVKTGSLGKIVEGYETEIVGPDDAPVALGESGRLRVRGGSVCRWWSRKSVHTAFR